MKKKKAQSTVRDIVKHVLFYYKRFRQIGLSFSEVIRMITDRATLEFESAKSEINCVF